MSRDRPTWVQTMRYARIRPSMYIGWQPTAHLGPPITGFLRAVWELQPWQEPRAATIAISPHQLHLRLKAGPLVASLERHFAWEDCDHLLCMPGNGALLDKAETMRFIRKTYSFADFGAPLYLAERGAVAIRTSAGLWCQTYQDGWPRVPPFLLKDMAPSLGLMVAAHLTPEWFTGLPYTREAVEKAIPEIARPHVTVEWYPDDHLLPSCPVDPRCVLHPENIGRWL